MARFGKYLREVLAQAKAKDGLSLEEIARRSALADGTEGIIKQTISRLAHGQTEPQVSTLKALARGLRGYTTYSKLLAVAGIEDAQTDTTPLSDKLRAAMVADGVPGDVVEQTVSFLEFQLERDTPKRRRRIG